MDKPIKLKNISFAYPGGNNVFEGMDFEYEIMTRVGITGANGSGKSTLFKLIMGLIAPLSGSVELFGRKMEREKDFASVRTRIGLLFQNPEDQILCPEVAEDIAFGPLNQGRSREEAEEAVSEALRIFRIEEYRSRNPFNLSGGEKHIVALAGLAAMKPEILLLDEPFDWLDPKRADTVLNYLRGMPSVILVSQDAGLLNEFCTAGVFTLESGRLR